MKCDNLTITMTQVEAAELCEAWLPDDGEPDDEAAAAPAPVDAAKDDEDQGEEKDPALVNEFTIHLATILDRLSRQGGGGSATIVVD